MRISRTRLAVCIARAVTTLVLTLLLLSMARAEDLRPVSAVAGTQPVTYTSRSGDTLLAVALRFGVTLDALRHANGITGDVLRSGQRLIIPEPRRKVIAPLVSRAVARNATDPAHLGRIVYVALPALIAAIGVTLLLLLRAEPQPLPEELKGLARACRIVWDGRRYLLGISTVAGAGVVGWLLLASLLAYPRTMGLVIVVTGSLLALHFLRAMPRIRRR